MPVKHQIDWARPAKIIRGAVAQFGEGYRQVSGPSIAEGDVSELVAKVRAMPAHEAAKVFFVSVDGGNPLTLEEVLLSRKD